MLTVARGGHQSSVWTATDELQIGRLHFCSRRHISRSRGLYRYVFTGATVVLSSLLTAHCSYQNTFSTQRTIALSVPRMVILASPMKTLAWTRLASSLASSLSMQ